MISWVSSRQSPPPPCDCRGALSSLIFLPDLPKNVLLQDPVQHAWHRQRERKQLLQQLATQPVRPPITRLPANVTLEEVERVDAIRRGHPGQHNPDKTLLGWSLYHQASRM